MMNVLLNNKNKTIDESYKNLNNMRIVAFIFTAFACLIAIVAMSYENKYFVGFLIFLCLSASLVFTFISYKGFKTLRKIEGIKTVFGSTEDFLIVFDRKIKITDIDYAVIVTNTETSMPFTNFDNQDRTIFDLFLKLNKKYSNFEFSNEERINDQMWIRSNFAAVIGYDRAEEAIPAIKKVLDVKGIKNHTEDNVKDFFNLAYKNLLK